MIGNCGIAPLLSWSVNYTLLFVQAEALQLFDLRV